MATIENLRLDFLRSDQVCSFIKFSPTFLYYISFSVNWTTSEFQVSRTMLSDKNAWMYYIDMTKGSLSKNQQRYVNKYDIIESPLNLKINSTEDNKIMSTLGMGRSFFRYNDGLLEI